MNPSKKAVLVTVSGKDTPGITSGLTQILSESRASILDIGQAVIHGQLSLSILFEMNEGDTHRATLKELLFRSKEMNLKLDFQVIENGFSERSGGRHRYALTVIADPVTAMTVHRVTQCLADFKLNIDSIQRMSESEFHCIELLVSSPDAINQHQMKPRLLEIAREQGVDIALQAEGLFRRSKRLVVLDMDSTLIQNEVIDEFARKKGVYEEVSTLTETSLHGKMSFDESLKIRCEKLSGLSVKVFDEVYTELKMTPGAEELIQVLKKLGYKIALLSGGFSCIADRLKEQLGITYAYANKLEVSDGKITGNLVGPIVNAQRKADLLELIAQQEEIHLDQVIAIGDGANDIPMLEKAGFGIAFNAKPVVSDRADFSLNKKNLQSIFYLLGISGREASQVLNGL